MTLLEQLFEQLKNFLLRRRQLRLSKSHASAPPLTDLDFFLLGAITKLFATGTTYPCSSLALFVLSALCVESVSSFLPPGTDLVKALVTDLTVKARLQAGSKSYSSSLDGIQKIIKEEGISGLYRGIGPKL